METVIVAREGEKDQSAWQGARSEGDDREDTARREGK